MAYTDIDDPTLYFRTKTYTGNGTNNTAYTWDETHANMRADWLWFKNRDESQSHAAFDSIRGALLRLVPNESGAEGTENTNLDSFDSNGFTVDNELIVNGSSDKMVAWGWSAGGSAPAITYVVKVVSDSRIKYRFDDFGTSAVTLDLKEGGTYTFDQSDSSNSGHP